MPAWRLHEDLLVFRALRMRIHRIGRSHWQAGARLRSWEVAPIHADGPLLLVPCAADEALWLGAWTSEGAPPAVLALQSASGDAAAQLALPAGFQLTALHDAAGHARPVGVGRYRLQLRCGRATQALELQALAPGEWARRSGRPAPPPLEGPPPLPPRLG